MNTKVTITQEQLDALGNSIQRCSDYLRASYTGSHSDLQLRRDLDLAHKTVAYMAHELYKTWTELPDGSTLKEIYRDDIWHPEQNPTNDDDPQG